MRRLLFIAGLAVLLSGCSRIQFAYNQLDWLIPYYIEMIVFVGGQLNDGQRKHLASMAESISRDFDQLACASEESVRHMTLK